MKAVTRFTGGSVGIVNPPKNRTPPEALRLVRRGENARKKYSQTAYCSQQQRHRDEHLDNIGIPLGDICPHHVFYLTDNHTSDRHLSMKKRHIAEAEERDSVD